MPPELLCSDFSGLNDLKMRYGLQGSGDTRRNSPCPTPGLVVTAACTSKEPWASEGLDEKHKSIFQVSREKILEKRVTQSCNSTVWVLEKLPRDPVIVEKSTTSNPEDCPPEVAYSSLRCNTWLSLWWSLGFYEDEKGQLKCTKSCWHKWLL